MNYGKNQYSTTVFGEAAARFIRDAPAAKPLFVYYAPYRAARARRAGDAVRRPVPEPAVVAAAELRHGEREPAGLPQATAKPLTKRQIRLLAQFRRRQYATLLSVDDEVGSIVDALRASDRLSNTMIVFASDNGLAWGAHRLPSAEKRIPYDEATRVPFVVRYDPMTTTPRTDSHLIVNTDWAPTFAALAGVSHPQVEGRSFLPLVQGATISPPWRTSFLIEKLGRQPENDRADLLRHPQHALPVRPLRHGRGGAVRPAARPVRPAQRRHSPAYAPCLPATGPRCCASAGRRRRATSCRDRRARSCGAGGLPRSCSRAGRRDRRPRWLGGCSRSSRRTCGRVGWR